MKHFWKNKKILAFIALDHHTRFITPVLEALSTRGAEVKYVVGQAERSQEITAINLGLSYSHIFDFISDKDHDEIHQNYKKLRHTFARLLKNDCMFGLQPVTVIDKTLHSTALEYTGIKNLLKKETPDLCFALHEINRWSKMLAFWSKKYHIPFISLQEGLAYGLDFGYSGHAQYSVLNLVWGKRVKNKLVSFEAPASKIIPVGNTHLSNEIASQKKNGTREVKREAYGISDHRVILLILSATLPDPTLFSPVFKAVSGHRGLTLFVKFHPACKKPKMDKWAAAISGQYKKNIYFIHSQENIYDLISISDLCVLGQPSTTGLEAVAFGKPLVKMDFAYTPSAPYSFVDQGVAVKMSAEELADALVSESTDFSSFIDKNRTQAFLASELTHTTQTVERVCQIFKTSIQASKYCEPTMDDLAGHPTKKWSIIIQVPENSKIFLAQIEALVFNSQDQADYEIILLEPPKKSHQTVRILDSLSGDLKRVVVPSADRAIEMMNQAAQTAQGERVVFLQKNLAPLKGWLTCLDKAFSQYGPAKLFGAQISNKHGTIENAGLVVDSNHTPVPAYHHLKIDFPAASKERSFQMVDHFIAMTKDLFLKLGAFSPDAGKFLFPDICLKAARYNKDNDTVVYLPNLKMILLEDPCQSDDMNDSVYFYSRWNSLLWESESALYKKDGLTLQDLAGAKLSAAMKTTR